jgi:hypothetical protein
MEQRQCLPPGAATRRQGQRQLPLVEEQQQKQQAAAQRMQQQAQRQHPRQQQRQLLAPPVPQPGQGQWPLARRAVQLQAAQSPPRALLQRQQTPLGWQRLAAWHLRWPLVVLT